MDLTYTYTIKSVNIQEGSFIVEYTPNDPELYPLAINSFLYEQPYYDLKDENGNLVYQNQDEVPFNVHLEYSISQAAPIGSWRRTKMVLNNLEQFPV